MPAAAVLVAMTLVSACGGDSSSPNAGSSSTSSSATASNDALLGSAAPATGSTIRIGLINGEQSTVGDLHEIGDAAVAAADYANDHLGGIAGHKIEVVRCADKADGASATACGNQFVSEGVAAVVSGQPAEAQLALPAVAGAKIPWVGVSPAASTELLSDDTFFFGPGLVGVLGAMARYEKDQNKPKNTTFAVENDQLNQAFASIGTPAFNKAGDQLKVLTIPLGTADATATVTAGLQSNPDVVGIVAEDIVCDAVLRGLSAAGYTGEKMVVTPCVAKRVIDAVGNDAMANTTVFSSTDPNTDDHEAQLYRAVMARYAAGTDPTGIAANGFLAMLSFVRAVNSVGISGDVTPAAVTGALKASKNVPLAAGHGAKFSCDHSAINFPLFKTTICNSDIFVSKLKDGKLSDYTVVDAAPLIGS
jgi:branched-chain amino acid transport system substrate-binding protein